MDHATTLPLPASRRPSLLGVGLVALTLLAVVLACGLGGDGWRWPDWSDPLTRELRLPRVLTALAVGGALAASGAALQALFRNPLADPGLIGTSSGAALGVIILMVFGVAGVALPVAAFAGGLAVTLLVLALNRLVGGGSAGLLIIGVVIGAFCGAVVSLLLFLSDDLALRSAMSWLAGNLADASPAALARTLPIMAAGLALLCLLGRDLDCLMLGEDAAAALGLRVERVRLLTAVAAALLTGAAVALSGVIGFVGMMVPNALALLVGGGRRRLIWLSAWVGGLFLLAIDTLGRSVAYPVDLPAGVLAAFAGPPFFLWLFFRQSRA